jgi:hypothetical protein
MTGPSSGRFGDNRAEEGLDLPFVFLPVGQSSTLLYTF